MEWTTAATLTLRLGTQAYNRRHLIQEYWKHLQAYLNVGDTQIAVSGSANVGKTLLVDQLHGKARKLIYSIPLESRKVDPYAIKIGEWQKLVRVLPGQQGYRAQGALKAFYENPSLEGIIHVVDFGYNRPRSDIIAETLVKSDGIDTIEKLRRYNLGAEVATLKELLTDIDRSLTKNGRPFWLVIAVNKVDLFVNDVDSALRYYHPNGDSAFAKLLSDFVSQIGSRNFRVYVIKSCAYEEDFEWNGTIIKSNLPRQQQNIILRNSLDVLSIISSESAQ